ncbi:MAG: TaqI-like C-terminal specificity domain-containing protein [Rikenellaceae bacterium]
MSHRAHSYEESLEREVRRAEGIYYTPADIVANMLSTVTIEGCERLCDPCCGAGNFLIGAIERGVKAENIFGYDKDAKAVAIARERVREMTGFDATNNIVVADFWSVAPKLIDSFDIVATNPPWGGVVEASYRGELTTKYSAGHSSDTATLMLFAVLTTLRKGGQMTILLPDAFFNIGGFEDARRKLLGLKITHLRDYGKAFKGLMTRAESITLTNRKSTQRQWAECSFEGQTDRRTLESFRKNPKSIINMWLSAEGAATVEEIFAKPHVTLHEAATWGMGIVTGNNAKYCHSDRRKGDIGVVRGYNIKLDGIAPCDTYIPSDLSLYQQVASEDFYLAREKIIYRFIASRPIFCYDPEQRYILNSANGFIPNEGFALSCEEIVERLNSDVVAWLFEALFRTHKILRSDLEHLPLLLDMDDVKALGMSDVVQNKKR